MKADIVALCVALCCLTLTHIEAKTVFRRADKIADNLKKLDLAPEEIDPNVAPPEPQKIETIDPQYVSQAASTSGNIIEETVTAIPVEVIDENANTVDGNVDIVDAAIPSTTVPSQAIETTTLKKEDDENGLGRYCKCKEAVCDCCREFRLPLLPIVRGPGCARIAFLGNDKMSVSLKYGDLTLASRTISGKRARPICVGLPGGYSQFCGRVYGLSRSEDNFKACLGFELRADDEVEAALRVSCFKFGPRGLRVAESEPLPSELNKDEDDDDDIFGFGAGADDEEEEEDDYEEEDDDDDEPEELESEENDDDDVAAADVDYGGFSFTSLLEELGDDDDETTKKPLVSVTSSVNTVAAQTRHVQQKEAAVENQKGVEGSETHATEQAAVENTDVKPTKSTKKKNKTKKKKSTSTSETDFGYEILNGILDFFN